MKDSLTFPPVDQVASDELPYLMAQVAAYQTALAARMAAIAFMAVRHPIENDEMLDVAEAAQRMSVSQTWLYRNWKSLPFARRISRKNLRFSRIGIDEWLKNSAA